MTLCCESTNPKFQGHEIFVAIQAQSAIIVQGTKLQFADHELGLGRQRMAEKVPPDIVSDPYADYVALLSEDFTPAKHANSLVLATNDPSDKQTDFTSPMKRIQYDLEEVGRRIDQLVTPNVKYN